MKSNEVISYNNAMEKYVSRNHGFTYGLSVIDILDLFPNFEETIEPYSFLGGTSTSIDIALLKALGRKYENCRYLEIGTWRGESIANMADIAYECVSIDKTKDRFFSNSFDNIQYYNNNSSTFDYSIFKEGFDIIYVDGNHKYENVKQDTENVFKLLKNENAVIVWHDYCFNPESIQWHVLAAILDGCPKEHKNNLYHVSNTLCAIFIKGNFETTFLNPSSKPNKVFKVVLSVKKVIND